MDQWVLIAGGRGARPHDISSRRDVSVGREAIPETDPDCPFCPGNEALLPGIKLERAADEPPGWSIRVVPNKFPLVSVLHSEPAASGEHISRRPVHGIHEVIIETWRHNGGLETMGLEQAAALLEVLQNRVIELLSTPEIKIVVSFRNHGRQGGTSLVHPHMQLVGIDSLPSHIQRQVIAARNHYEMNGTCLLCEVMARERSEGERVVLEPPGFFGFVPFAAEAPYEVWLAPLEHQADFARTSSEEFSVLADALLALISLYQEELNDPDYNLLLFTPPAANRKAPSLHWLLRLLPRLTTPAGFKIATGMKVNPSMPEADASTLRRSRSADC